MSAVIRLDDYRPAPIPCCPRHALEDLAERIAARLDAEPTLLVARSVLEASLADLRATTTLLLPDGQEVRP